MKKKKQKTWALMLLPSLPSSTAWTQYLSSLDLFPDLNDEECTTLLPGRGVRLVKCMTQ